MNYGNQLWRYERYAEAIDTFKRVIRLDANFDAAYYGMGLAYYFQGKQKSSPQVNYRQAVTAL